jgi:glycerol-3-phosphate acyltransferase PlsX
LSITLAVDAMGGDGAPDIVVKGVALALQSHLDVNVILYGDSARLIPLLTAEGIVAPQVTIQHTIEAIPGDMKPSAALRNRSSSMRLAIEAVAEGKADAVISAGNTGAYMALAKIILKTLPGIDRPAIARPIPTMRGESVMLDLGANIECTADNLAQFALMGAVFAKKILNLSSPSVGLLNVGEEHPKGNAIVKETHQFLTENKWVDNFHGFIEGDQILAGVVDVVVTDGFTGNVALKTAEGTYALIKNFLDQGFRSSIFAKIGYLFSKPMLGKIGQKLDPRHYNGAPFLGLNGIAVKSHGGTDAYGFQSALKVAIDMAGSKVIQHIRQELERHPANIQTGFESKLMQ